MAIYTDADTQWKNAEQSDTPKIVADATMIQLPAAFDETTRAMRQLRSEYDSRGVGGVIFTGDPESLVDAHDFRPALQSAFPYAKIDPAAVLLQESASPLFETLDPFALAGSPNEARRRLSALHEWLTRMEVAFRSLEWRGRQNEFQKQLAALVHCRIGNTDTVVATALRKGYIRCYYHSEAYFVHILYNNEHYPVKHLFVSILGENRDDEYNE